MVVLNDPVIKQNQRFTSVKTCFRDEDAMTGRNEFFFLNAINAHAKIRRFLQARAKAAEVMELNTHGRERG